MTTLALLLMALGLADFAAGGLEGRPRSATRTGASAFAAVILIAVMALGLGGTGREALFSTLLVLAVLVAWLAPRSAKPDSPAAARIALSGLGAGIVVAFAAAPAIEFKVSGPARLWFDRHTYVENVAADPEALLFVAGCVLFLSASANALVRVLLTIAGTEIRGGETRLKGGRYIGVLERLMIFGLALAGEPTAAALVISAKSLLRFPELQRASRRKEADTKPESGPMNEGLKADVDVVTEYFLLGSLASWALALWPLLFLG